MRAPPRVSPGERGGRASVMAMTCGRGGSAAASSGPPSPANRRPENAIRMTVGQPSSAVSSVAVPEATNATSLAAMIL